jgi:hypothetical protein
VPVVATFVWYPLSSRIWCCLFIFIHLTAMSALSGRALGSRQLSWTHHGQQRFQQCRASKGSSPARTSSSALNRGSIRTQVSRNSFTSTGTPQQQQQSVLQRAFANPPQWGYFLGSLALSGAALGTALDGIHSRVGLQVSNRLHMMCYCTHFACDRQGISLSPAHQTRQALHSRQTVAISGGWSFNKRPRAAATQPLTLQRRI